MDSELTAQLEPLPGYTLAEKIGSGGYGEVWRAEAPGGLEKAIKFVFGAENEKRATHELKSLQRVKELRHPFLLSLERIEIVQGRLLVVTELADGSVKDKFDDYLGQGQNGIPRDELLRYLRDAADALDFMVNEHSLQHLDIKPENLLLVAGHVKVADFGLVKDVHHSQASIVGGMTPLYSAPEVFRGQPSSRSDQYSLAILYQEMLTGTLPFSGGNAAELTLQHLNDEPNLSALKGQDRYVVSRALSKDPRHRYASCLEFVTALLQADLDAADAQESPATRPAATATAVADGARQSIATEVFEDDPEAFMPESMLIDLGESGEAQVRALPPANFDPESFQPAPTVFIGIGGAAGRTLAHLKKQLCDRFGNLQAVPAVRMLVLDTDTTALTRLSDGCDGSITPDETMSLPLRRPQHYRENSSRLLKWLSRRWLYNIPKSMRTEGLRPLGRLALVDHARQACQRIRQLIAQASDDSSTATTADAIGRPMASGACRVYVVASVAGGTGSGMLLDVAYAVRAALDKLNIADAETIGVLLYSTGRDPNYCDLARVNAYSWLNEYQHFLKPTFPYPGDESCGLPGHDPSVPPFNQTYMLHLGEGLVEDDYDQQLASVADYLHIDGLTAANTFFGACRGPKDATPLPEQGPTLRTFGIERVRAAGNGLSDSTAADIARRVVVGWQAHPDADSPAKTSTNILPMPLVETLGLTPSALAAQALKHIAEPFGESPQEFVSTWLRTHVSAADIDSPANSFAALDQLFRKPDGKRELDGSLMVGKHTLATLVAPVESQLRQSVRESLVKMLDEPTARLPGTLGAAAELAVHLKSVQAELQELKQQTAAQLVAERRSTQEEVDGEQCPTPEQTPVAYFNLRLQHCALIAAEHLVRTLVADGKVLDDTLAQLERELKQIAQRFDVEGSAAELERDELSAQDANHHIESSLHKPTQREELRKRVDQQLQTGYFDQNGGLLQTIMSGGRTRAQLLAVLREKSQHAVQEALGRVNVLESVFAAESENFLAEQLRAATPQLLEHGGGTRLVAVVPQVSNDSKTAEKIQGVLDTQVQTVSGYDNSFALCVEGEEVPLAAVALGLVQRRRDYVEFAERVRTRSDIRWTNITENKEKDEAVRETTPRQTTLGSATDAPVDSAPLDATQMIEAGPVL